MSFSFESLTAAFNRGGVKTTGPLAELRGQLSDNHAEHPQNHALAMHHLNGLEEALSGLASLGHRLEIRKVPQDQTSLEFPKALFHEEQAPGEMLVHSASEEAEARSQGWHGMGQAEAQASAPMGSPMPGMMASSPEMPLPPEEQS